MQTTEPRPALDVISAGFITIQDLGRPGAAALGVAANGAADQHSARLANVLVGNRQGAPLLESVGSRIVVRALRPVLVSLTGAVEAAVSESAERPTYQPFMLGANETLTVEPNRFGMRWYLGIRGEIEAERLFGSVAMDPFLGVGRQVRAGEVIRVANRFEGLDHPFSRIPLFRFRGSRPARFDSHHTIDATLGPDTEQFPDLPTLFERAFTVSQASDHVGVRLHGDAPTRAPGQEILSRGVPIGAIEVPPGGGLIALLRGRFVTAGYPIPAVATTRGLAALGQLRPGEQVRFRLVDMDAAVRQARADAAGLTDLASHVERAFVAAGVPVEAP